MSIRLLAEALAERQPHAVPGGKARIAQVRVNPDLPAQRPSRAKIRRITRPGNDTKSPRAFMESPRRKPLSEPQ